MEENESIQPSDSKEAAKPTGGVRQGAGRKKKTLESEAARLLFGGGDMGNTSGLAELRNVIIGKGQAKDKIAAVRLCAEIMSGKFLKDTPEDKKEDTNRTKSLEELKAKVKEILGEASGSGRTGINSGGTGEAKS